MSMQKFLFITLIGLSLIHPTFAQTTSNISESDVSKASLYSYNASVNESDIDVLIDPEFPSAFENVSIRLDSNSIDLNRYTIDWVTDDFQHITGTGKRYFTMTTGGYGTRKKITVTISGAGTRIVKTITLTPQDATLLWEAVDSYVPPFYYGKKLAGQESLIKFSALPNFQGGLKSTHLNDAIYLWTRNNNRVLNMGGYEHDSLLIQHNKLRAEEKMTVDISTVAGNTKAQKTVIVPISSPQIHWYYRDNYNYRKPLSIDRGLRVGQGDTNIIAEPYFFSLNKVNDLNFTWKMNNETLYLDPSAPKQELLVRNPNQSGQVTFSTSIENPKTFLQTASGATTLYFQKPPE
jgi:hypothetical protein